MVQDPRHPACAAVAKGIMAVNLFQSALVGAVFAFAFSSSMSSIHHLQEKDRFSVYCAIMRALWTNIAMENSEG
jgi:hypothetical protein